MAVANFYVYCGEGGITVEQTNLFLDSLSKKRAWTSHDGIELMDLTVITNEPESSFRKEVGSIISYDPNKFDNPFWNIIFAYKHASDYLHGDSKAIILQGNIYGQDLLAIPSLKVVPERGTTTHSDVKDQDEIDMVRDQNLIVVQQFQNWWNDDTEYAPHYMGIAASSCKHIWTEFNKQYETIVDEYDPDPYGFQQWIECDIEEDLFYLNQHVGIISPYAVGKPEIQQERNQLWEDNVRPTFNVDDGWRGIGGEIESLLFETEHEYRTVSRQVSWFILEGDTSNILEEDEYFRWWIY